MSTIKPLFPRRTVPDLSVPLAGGGNWTLGEKTPENFTMVVVYRGLHCPICKSYLNDLQRRLPEFEKHGVEVLVLSSDNKERAEKTRDEWGLDALTLGYGLTLEKGREWGLYISSGIGTTSIGIEEPALFVEPGLFLVRPDKTLYFASIQTMPFARPAFGDIVTALGFVLSKNYPARGEITDFPAQAAE